MYVLIDVACNVTYFHVRVSAQQISNTIPPCCTLGMSNPPRSTTGRNYGVCNISEAVHEDFPVLFTKILLCEWIDGSEYQSVFMSVVSHE